MCQLIFPPTTDRSSTLLLKYVYFTAAIVVASAVPGLPTAEIVSSVTATQDRSLITAAVIFVTAWVGSCVGDMVLLTEARLASGRLGTKLQSRLAGRRVGKVVARLGRNPVGATAIARLIPGARAVTLVTFGLTRASRRRVLLGDAIGCGAWAALYTSVGFVGGRVTGHPVVAVGIAAALALVVSQCIRLLLGRREQPAVGAPSDPDADLAARPEDSQR